MCRIGVFDGQNRFGRRGLVAVAAATLAILPFALLWRLTESPWIVTSLLGVAYTVAAACVWSAVRLVVDVEPSGERAARSTS